MAYDHKSENAFNQFAMKMFIKENGKEKIIGHFFRETLRPAKSLLARGAILHAEISSVEYRNSPLVQGGVELSWIVFVSMASTVLTVNLITRYKSLVASLYIEPKEAKVYSFESEKKIFFS